VGNVHLQFWTLLCIPRNFRYVEKMCGRIQGKTVSYSFLKNEWTWYMIWCGMIHSLKTSLARARVGTHWLNSTVNCWVNVLSIT